MYINRSTQVIEEWIPAIIKRTMKALLFDQTRCLFIYYIIYAVYLDDIRQSNFILTAFNERVSKMFDGGIGFRWRSYT
jgi:hypothetical protein